MKYLATHKHIVKTLELMTFDELTQEVQDEVLLEFNREYGEPELYEHRKALEEFARLMDVSFDYSFDECGTYYKNVKTTAQFVDVFHHGQDEELTGVRLATFIHNNYYKYLTEPKKYWTKSGKVRASRITRAFDGCHLTGLYVDDLLTNTVKDFLDHAGTKYSHWNYLDVMDEVLCVWIRACQKEYEYHYSRDFAVDTFDCWNTLFSEDGQYFSELDQTAYDLEELT